MAPLFEHYGVQLWLPEAGGRVDCRSEHDEQVPAVRVGTRTEGNGNLCNRSRSDSVL